MRPNALKALLNSVKAQSLYPDEIIIVDGSTDTETQDIFFQNKFENLKYFKVEESDRGLTKQRNFGINKVSKSSEIISFLDDDTILSINYFEVLIQTYLDNSNVTGVGGVSTNDYNWKENKLNKKYNTNKFYDLEGYIYKEGIRNVIRNYLKLNSDKLPGIMPEFSNGRTCGYPFTEKSYEVDLLIGMSFSFKKIVYQNIKFSTYFEGYGLYEDADYSLRALKYGKNVINTKLQLEHHHNPDGRPNKFKYGLMVIRNGWYVWRIKYPKPSFVARFKWNAIAFVLTALRFGNVITTSERKSALTEALGRTYGWFSLLFNKPIIKR